MYQWSCGCWVEFHFKIFWAKYHPQYFRLLSTSSEYSVRLFKAGFGISHRIKIKLTGWDFCKRVKSDLFLTAGLGLYTSSLKTYNTSLKSSCFSFSPASLALPLSCIFYWLGWGLIRGFSNPAKASCVMIWSLKTFSITSALQWPCQTGLEHLHQHLSRTCSLQSSSQCFCPKPQAAALSAPHSISSTAPTGSASNSLPQMLRHSGKGTDRTACSEKHIYPLEHQKKGKVKQ